MAISKYGREVGEKEITAESEGILAEPGEEHRKDSICSENAYLAVKPCRTKRRLYKQCSSFIRRHKEHPKTTFKGPHLDKAGHTTKVSRTGLMSDLKGIFFLLSLIKNLWNDVVEH